MSLQYIIDGYNVINHPHFPTYKKDTKDLPSALLDFIKAERLTGSSKNKIIIVFDGFPKPDRQTSYEDNVSIIFSRKINADEKIKMLIEESAQRKNIIVISDDKELQLTVKFLGVRHLGVEEFIKRKEKLDAKQKAQLIKAELNYTQIHKINQELKKIWLS